MTLMMLMYCRPASRSVHEVGAKVLSFIPDAVTAHTNVDFQSLPRIMASCDALVKAEASGDKLYPSLVMTSATACSARDNNTRLVMQVLCCAS